MTDSLETQIRNVLGEHNDTKLPVVTAVKRLVEASELRLEQLLVCKPDAERYRKLKRLGNRWIGQARAVAAQGETAPSIDEQLDQLPDREGVEVPIPMKPGVGYRIPYHPTKRQVIEICASIRPDFATLSTGKRSQLDGKVRLIWRAIAEQINEPPATRPMAVGE
nr:hypothetical protein 2 [Saccharospirillaceae bacterium]